jgi:Subtilase family
MTSVPPESRQPAESSGFGYDLPPDVGMSPTGDYFFRVGELLVSSLDFDRVPGLREFLEERGHVRGHGQDEQEYGRDRERDEDRGHGRGYDHGGQGDHGHGGDHGGGDGHDGDGGGTPLPPAPPGVVIVDLDGIDRNDPRRDRGGPAAQQTIAVVDEIEERFPDAAVELNYVYIGSQSVMGGPATLAEPSAEPFPVWPGTDVGAGFTVGVLDTGIIGADGKTTPHPLLAGRFLATAPSDEDIPAEHPQPFLDKQGGHGTFIAGVVRKTAPGARIAVHRVLRATGDGDVRTVLAGIAELNAAVTAAGLRLDVLNLSLGGYTRHDRPPVLLTAALTPLMRTGTVVVAAAGNHSSWRPFWPAALPQVIGVGALDGRGPAPYSNYGPWVDACAVGTDVISTFFDETAHPLPQVDLAPHPWSNVPIPARFPGYARWSGTSFAAPAVAAAIVAAAWTWKISATDAANRLVRDWHHYRVPDLGVVVNTG